MKTEESIFAFHEEKFEELLAELDEVYSSKDADLLVARAYVLYVWLKAVAIEVENRKATFLFI